jgi:hypothetical protein
MSRTQYFTSKSFTDILKIEYVHKLGGKYKYLVFSLILHVSQQKCSCELRNFFSTVSVHLILALADGPELGLFQHFGGPKTLTDKQQKLSKIMKSVF